MLDETGEIAEKVGFDTEANSFESEKLADFLGSVATGRPVLVASYGNASANLTETAVTALRNLGADLSLATLQGQHFAIIGVQGAQPGSAALTIDPTNAFLRVSLDRDRRPLAAAVDWVRIARE